MKVNGDRSADGETRPWEVRRSFFMRTGLISEEKYHHSTQSTQRIQHRTHRGFSTEFRELFSMPLYF